MPQIIVLFILVIAGCFPEYPLKLAPLVPPYIGVSNFATNVRVLEAVKFPGCDYFTPVL